MSSNNYQPNGAVVGLALMAVAGVFLAIIVYIVAGVIAAIFTGMSVLALWKPLKIGKHIITPKEARWFIGRGIIGVYAFPFIAAIVAHMLKTVIEPDWRIHLMAIGYILGSLGGEWVIYVFQQANKEEEVQAPPAPPIAPPKMTYQGKPFDYATWDDENEVDPYK